jgi:hypothetical protein
MCVSVMSVDAEAFRLAEIVGLRGVAENVTNSNGRAYLYQVARELNGDVREGA